MKTFTPRGPKGEFLSFGAIIKGAENSGRVRGYMEAATKTVSKAKGANGLALVAGATVCLTAGYLSGKIADKLFGKVRF